METKIIPKRVRSAILKMLLEFDYRMKHEQNMSFTDIYHGIQAIIELQKDYSRKPINREMHMNELLEWAMANRVDCSCITINKYEHYGFGLQATKDVKKGEKILEIPNDFVFSQKTFLASDLGKMIQKLNLMPGVSLALSLLCETFKPDSFWMPYINSLPSEYSMLLYFTPQEMELLCDSSLQNQALKFYQIVLSSYLVIYKKMEEEPDKKKLWPIKNFCFEDFRWAVCTALTRQNTIQNLDGSKEFVFIPLWDMCNHTWGEISTSFVYSSETIISEAMKDFRSGEQVLIHYGDRSLSEMFLYGGYIIQNAPSFQLAVKINLSTKDPAYEMKLEALGYLGLEVPYILKVGSKLQPKCLAFVRIFCMPKELLARFLKNPTDLNLLEEEFLWISIRHEIEVWKFLMGRCMLTERSYKNALEHDLQSLCDCKSDKLQEIYKLRVEEKQILRRFSSFCQLRVNFLQDCVPEFDSTLEKMHGHMSENNCSNSYPFICVGSQCLNDGGKYLCCHVDFNKKESEEKVDGSIIIDHKEVFQVSENNCAGDHEIMKIVDIKLNTDEPKPHINNL